METREPAPDRTFGRVADVHARTRPPYSRVAVDRAAAELALAPDTTVLDLAAPASTPASIPDAEREAIAARAYPLMDASYEIRVVTMLYWRLLP